MKRYLIFDGAMAFAGRKLTPHTSFNTLAEAKRFLASLEEEDVYIRDSKTGQTWWYQDGQIVEETEI